jgi:hypothetical protein
MDHFEVFLLFYFFNFTEPYMSVQTEQWFSRSSVSVVHHGVVIGQVEIFFRSAGHRASEVGA